MREKKICGCSFLVCLAVSILKYIFLLLFNYLLKKKKNIFTPLKVWNSEKLERRKRFVSVYNLWMVCALFTPQFHGKTYFYSSLLIKKRWIELLFALIGKTFRLSCWIYPAYGFSWFKLLPSPRHWVYSISSWVWLGSAWLWVNFWMDIYNCRQCFIFL